MFKMRDGKGSEALRCHCQPVRSSVTQPNFFSAGPRISLVRADPKQKRSTDCGKAPQTEQQLVVSESDKKAKGSGVDK